MYTSVTIVHTSRAGLKQRLHTFWGRRVRPSILSLMHYFQLERVNLNSDVSKKLINRCIARRQGATSEVLNYLVGDFSTK